MEYPFDGEVKETFKKHLDISISHIGNDEIDTYGRRAIIVFQIRIVTVQYAPTAKCGRSTNIAGRVWRTFGHTSSPA